MTKWLACALALFVTQLGSQVAKPNFSGDWMADPSKSMTKSTLKEKPGPEAPQAPSLVSPAAQLMEEHIEHRGLSLKIMKLLPEGGMSIMKFTTDGTENLNQVAGGPIRHRSKSYWNGEKLITEWALLRDSVVFMTGKDVRSLSLDGRRMTVHRQMSDSKSETTVHTEYRKQPGLKLLQ